MRRRHLKIRTSKTGHIFTSGNPEQARNYWMVFHGYGQLASGLLSRFNSFPENDHYVVAPEGLHRFYWKGVSEQPVASWMTSLDRQDDIADYVNFLDRVKDVTGFEKGAGKQRFLFGFSQGCATVWRWILNTHPDFDYLLLWAGWLPEDMDYQPHLSYLEGKKIHYIHGSEDEYLTKSRLSLLKQRFRDAGMHVTYHLFDGKHRVPPAQLKRIHDLVSKDDMS